MCREVRNERALARTAFARGEAQDVHGCAPNHLIAGRVRNFPDSSKGNVTARRPPARQNNAMSPAGRLYESNRKRNRIKTGTSAAPNTQLQETNPEFSVFAPSGFAATANPPIPRKRY